MHTRTPTWRTPIHRLRRSPTLATALLLVWAMVTACGGGTGAPAPSAGGERPSTPGTRSSGPGQAASSGPAGPQTPTTPTTTAGTGHRQTRTAVYFLHGQKISPAPRTVTAPATAADALRALLAGPDRYERGHGRTTAIPPGTTLRSVQVRDHVATVDLSGRYDDVAEGRSMRARLAQVVFTATRFPAIHKVRFELDGKPVTSFGTERIVLDRPVGRTDFESLTPLVLVESPLIGDTVRSPVRIWGSANTFEATLQLKITDAAGRTAADVYATATSGTGTRGTFDVTIPYKASRAGAGTLTAFWTSPEHGRVVIEDTVPLTLAR